MLIGVWPPFSSAAATVIGFSVLPGANTFGDADVGGRAEAGHVGRVVGRPLRHRQDRAGPRLHHHDRAVPRVVCSTRCLHTCSASYWMSDWMVSRRFLAGTAGRQLRLGQRDRLAVGSLLDFLAAVAAGQQRVVLLSRPGRAGQAAVAWSVGEPDDVSGQVRRPGSWWCSSAVMSMPGSSQRADAVAGGHRHAACEHLVLRRLTGDRAWPRIVAAGSPSGPASLSATPGRAAAGNQLRVGEHGVGLHRHRQHGAVAGGDRAADGRDRDRASSCMLLGSVRSEPSRGPASAPAAPANIDSANAMQSSVTRSRLAGLARRRRGSRHGGSCPDPAGRRRRPAAAPQSRSRARALTPSRVRPPAPGRRPAEPAGPAWSWPCR